MSLILTCRQRRLDLHAARVMGILNITPDSFSDGGEYFAGGRPRFDQIIQQAARQVAAGASVLDVGGESTRPGALAVSLQEELDRTIPVIEVLAARFDVMLSIDTSKTEVMRAAVSAGAHMVNDVSALAAPGAVDLVAQEGLGACLMHRKGQPVDMQRDPSYVDVVAEVYEFLRQRLEICLAAGIQPECLVVDPGFGFGKTHEHNLRLLRELAAFNRLGFPILVGLSRKSTIGQLVDKPVSQRLPGSLAAAVIAVQAGARLVRVHDVAETVDALKIVNALAGVPLA